MSDFLSVLGVVVGIVGGTFSGALSGTSPVSVGLKSDSRSAMSEIFIPQ